MSSVFNLVEDYDGNIYCNNLSGQVFRWSGTHCRLFFSVPDSIASADIGLEVDNLNRLVVRASGLMFLNQHGTIEDYYNLGYSGYSTRMADSSIWVYSEKTKQFLVFKDGKINEQPPFHADETERIIYNMVEVGPIKYKYSLNNCKLYGSQNNYNELLIDPEKITRGSKSNRLYTTSNSIWLAPNSAGVYRFNQNLELINSETPYFPNTLISAVCQDAEGNILLGTFGSGLIVIPNVRTLDFIFPNKEEKAISITRSENGVLYIGTLSGKIYAIDDKDVSLFREGDSKRMESLFAVEGNQLVIGDFNGAIVSISNKSEVKLEVGSIKDVAVVNEDSALVASNVGAFWLNLRTGQSIWLNQLRYRLFCIGHNAVTQSVYAGTARGLAIFSSHEKVKFVELEGKTIRARDFESFGNEVFIATAGHGLLKFVSDSMATHWNTSTGLISDNLYELQLTDNEVIISTDKGV